MAIEDEMMNAAGVYKSFDREAPMGDGSDILEQIYNPEGEQPDNPEVMDDSELAAVLGEYQRQAIGYYTDEISDEQIKAIKELAGSANSKIVLLPSKGGVPIILDGKQ